MKFRLLLALVTFCWLGCATSQANFTKVCIAASLYGSQIILYTSDDFEKKRPVISSVKDTSCYNIKITVDDKTARMLIKVDVPFNRE